MGEQLWLRASLPSEQGAAVLTRSMALFPQSHALHAEMNLPRDEAGNVDCKALVDQLRICPTLQEQADILYMLHILKYGKL